MKTSRHTPSTAAPPQQSAGLIELQGVFGAESAEMEILTEADGAAEGFAKDGEITEAELDAAAAMPAADAKFVASRAADTFLMAVHNSPDSAGIAIDSLTTPWQKMLAQRADGAGTDGKKDGLLKSSELLAYLRSALDKQWTDTPAKPPKIVGDQRLDVLKSEIARFTDESDIMNTGTTSRVLDRGSFKVVYDDLHKIPRYVIHTLSDDDFSTRPIDHRSLANTRGSTSVVSEERFKADPELMAAGVGSDPAWYIRSGYDRGHHVPWADYCDGPAADQSFLMSNIAPQTAELNQYAWATLEQDIRDAVQETKAKVTIITGSLFLDALGNPLPEEQVQWIGPDKDVPDGERRVAVPTHFYKAAYVELPNGRRKMFAYMMPNDKSAPTADNEIEPFIAKSKVSVATLTKLVGDTFFKDLPTAERERLSAETNGVECMQRFAKWKPHGPKNALAARIAGKQKTVPSRKSPPVAQALPMWRYHVRSAA